MFLVTAAALAAQTPRFDVAAVRVSTVKANDKFAADESITPAANGLTMAHASLLSCIEWAYGLKEYQVAGPDWLRFERYDITAKASAAVSGEELRQMLQSLLQDRFRLASHREERELPVYALVTGKGPVKLDPAATDGKPGFGISEGSLVFRNYSLGDWAEWASVGHAFGLDRAIIDQTGLNGTYNFRLPLAESAMDLKMNLKKGQQDPTMYNSALQALGLRLEPRKAPVRVLVVDRAEKVPSEN